MQAVDVVIESAVARSFRVDALESVYDCPMEAKQRLEFHVELPDLQSPWNIGLIVGPSGSGKTTVAKHAYGEPKPWSWPRDKALIDAIAPDKPMTEVAAALGAVGLNTIPSWARPFHVLSNGEQFRATIARHLLEDPSVPIVVDEFTSVVDRQVAKVASHAVQKYVRRHGKKFVAVACHYDIIDWLQPDWVLDMAAGRVEARRLRRRPAIECTVARVPYDTWKTFAPFHYMSRELNKSARCFALFVDGKPVSFASVLYRPVSAKGRHAPVNGFSRLVTLPDYQGLGLIFVLIDTIGGYYKARGSKLNVYPAHPSLIGSLSRSDKWHMIKAPGKYTPKQEGTIGAGGGRPNAVFQYVGPALNIDL